MRYMGIERKRKRETMLRYVKGMYERLNMREIFIASLEDGSDKDKLYRELELLRNDVLQFERKIVNENIKEYK